MSTVGDLYEWMKAWEEHGAVGSGPAEVRDAAESHPGRYRSALTARYPDPLFRPLYTGPQVVKGTTEGPSPHDDRASFAERKWKNYLDEHSTPIAEHGWRAPSINTADVFERATVVAEALVAARAAHRRIHPVAAGHSASAVAKPDDHGHLITADGLGGVGAPVCVRAGVPTGHLRMAGAGIRLRALNQALAAERLSLLNLGGYDGQTLAGALFTGTHGSGLHLPALYGTVASIWLVTLDAAGAPLLRVVEPAGGISDATAVAAGASKAGLRAQVDQRDDWFDAVVLGMGWFGMVVAVTLQVQPEEWIAQTKELMPLARAAARLEEDQAAVERLEWVLNPQPVWQLDGTWDHSCLVVKRTTIPRPAGGKARWPTTRFLSYVDDQIGEAAGSVTARMAQVLAGRQGVAPLLHNTLGSQQCQRFATAMPQALVLAAGNHFLAKSCELFVPYAQTLPAVHRVLEVARAEAAAGRRFNAPMGVRFCALTRGWLSPTDRGDGQPSASIEVPILLPRRAGHPRVPAVDRMLTTMIDALAQAPYGARPHWGQFHRLDAGSLPRFYAPHRIAAYAAARREFDPTNLFGNALSDALGF